MEKELTQMSGSGLCEERGVSGVWSMSGMLPLLVFRAESSAA